MKKIWVRVIISFLIGGAIQETVSIVTGKEIHILAFVLAIISFFIISAIYYAIQIRKMKSGNDEFGEIFEE